MSLSNQTNSHTQFFSSKVGGVSGCGGPSSSPEALTQSGLHEFKKGGSRRRRSRKHHKKHYKGGVGYGFSKDQSLSSTSGVNNGDSIHRAGFSSYSNEGVNSITNMGASKQHGGSSGYSYGTGGYPYYSYKPSQGDNLSVFAGSGYPPIVKGLNSQCGGRKRKTMKKHSKKRMHKKHKSHKKHHSKRRSHKKHSKRRSHKKHSRRHKKGGRYEGVKGAFTRFGRKGGQKGGYSQYGSNIANSHIYSTGAPPSLNYKTSALAQPVPYTPKQDCLNTWKHNGSENKPYNTVYN